MITGNKGEWSEIYAFLKLLGDTVLYAGDEDLNRIDNLFYPIIKIIRKEHGDEYNYIVNENDNNIIIKSMNGEELLNLPIRTFSDRATELLNVIKSNRGSISAEQIENFMNSIFCFTLKAKSNDKADIHIVLHDLKTGLCPMQGYSIKSLIGNNPTLLNASGSTVLVYEISDVQLSDDELRSINAETKIRDKINAISEKSGKIKLREFANDKFRNNLALIDGDLPHMISTYILDYFSSGRRNIKEITESFSIQNPLNFVDNEEYNYYEYKIKHALTDVALGMKPNTKWNGIYDATGGFLVVKEDGDVLCYHIYDKNLFEDYLYKNTYFDTPDLKRTDCGIIEKDSNGCYTLRLNFQIRFLK